MREQSEKATTRSGGCARTFMPSDPSLVLRHDWGGVKTRRSQTSEPWTAEQNWLLTPSRVIEVVRPGRIVLPIDQDLYLGHHWEASASTGYNLTQRLAAAERAHEPSRQPSAIPPDTSVVGRDDGFCARTTAQHPSTQRRRDGCR